MNIIKRIFKKLYLIIIKPITAMKMKKLGVQFYAPNYVYFDIFNESSVIIDVGCGHEAEFSKHLIQKYNLQAYGVDPTRKHAPFLKKLEEITKGRFNHLALALSKCVGITQFNESKTNESGSLLKEHVNVKNDEITTYQVEAVSIIELLERIGKTQVDLIKLDLEGAEYDLLESITEKDTNSFKQIFVEFHHHCTNYSTHDTSVIVNKFRNIGFKVFTSDYHNYLFYR